MSNFGRVKSLKRRGVRTDRLLKPRKTKDGYLIVYLTKEKGIDKGYLVHRLVALTFLPNDENKQEVDHLNCKRDDNRAENLSWVTHSENCNNPISRKNYSISSSKRNFVITEEMRSKMLQARRSKPNPLKGVKRPIEVCQKISKSKYKKVAQYSLDGVFLKEWESIQAASEGTGISRNSIGKIANGKRRRMRKYLWKFV